MGNIRQRLEALERQIVVPAESDGDCIVFQDSDGNIVSGRLGPATVAILPQENKRASKRQPNSGAKIGMFDHVRCYW